ncbi:unnamed protein product [Amoebophrya sp. A25]|nr:unnamed protein product [Amoebophrya sp. A25]|eukprot:GSA25T00017618001.1
MFGRIFGQRGGGLLQKGRTRGSVQTESAVSEGAPSFLGSTGSAPRVHRRLSRSWMAAQCQRSREAAKIDAQQVLPEQNATVGRRLFSGSTAFSTRLHPAHPRKPPTLREVERSKDYSRLLGELEQKFH